MLTLHMMYLLPGSVSDDWSHTDTAPSLSDHAFYLYALLLRLQFCCWGDWCCRVIVVDISPKTKMTVEKQPFEDASPIKMVISHCHVNFWGVILL